MDIIAKGENTKEIGIVKFETHRLYDLLIERFSKWTETRQDIRAAIIIGSRARHDHPADEWADLDLIVITTEPDYYVSTDDWVNDIGRSLLTFTGTTTTGETERRVLYDGMLDVDFAIISIEKAQRLIQAGMDSQRRSLIADIFVRGIRILIDRDGMFSQLQTHLPSIKAPPPNPPTIQEFLQVVNDFLYHAVFTAKHLKRGELWWAKMCSECHMQQLLLKMIEWHARATHLSHDTWFRGRFLEEWAEPRILEEMRSAFSHYDKADTSRALLKIIDLFSWVSKETANRLGYSYPTDADQQITKWVNECLSE